MQYPLGSPTCWNASNLNCTTKDAQCGYGCVNNSGVEIAAMAEYPHMRLYMNTYGGSKVPLAESSNTGWLLPEDMGGKFSAMCWVSHAFVLLFDFELCLISRRQCRLILFISVRPCAVLWARLVLEVVTTGSSRPD